MAVNYNKGMDDLLNDLRRKGLDPTVLNKTGDQRPLAAEIAVKGDVVIHWDRHSRSLWTEGPWPAAARLEARLGRSYQGARFRRVARRPKVIASILAAAAVLGASYFVSVYSRSPKFEETRRPASTAEAPLFASGRDFR